MLIVYVLCQSTNKLVPVGVIIVAESRGLLSIDLSLKFKTKLSTDVMKKLLKKTCFNFSHFLKFCYTVAQVTAVFKSFLIFRDKSLWITVQVLRIYFF